MEVNIQSIPLLDLAKKIKEGHSIKIGRGVDAVHYYCPVCNVETHGYVRHANGLTPLVFPHDDDIYYEGNDIVLPEVEKCLKEQRPDYFGFGAKMHTGICPKCDDHSAQIWVYDFANFPKPNIRNATHRFGTEELYRIDPAEIIVDPARGDLRQLEMDGVVIGHVFCYQDTMVRHDAFNGWPRNDFKSNVLFFYIDQLDTREPLRIPFYGVPNSDFPEDSLLPYDWQDARVVTRELRNAAEKFWIERGVKYGPNR